MKYWLLFWGIPKMGIYKPYNLTNKLQNNPPPYNLNNLMGPFFCLRNFSPPLRQKTGSEPGSNLERVNDFHGMELEMLGIFNNLQVTLRNLEKKRTQHLHLAHGFSY